MRHRLVFLISLILLGTIIIGCDTVVSTNSASTPGDWLISEDEIFDGGPGKDGIPALDSPNFLVARSAAYLSDDDLVLVMNINNLIRIYPHPILDWHEIINDKIGNTAIAVTYCPLTGSGICWDRVLNGEETTFGVSGLLYNTNLIPYDRKTQSNWSQMRLQSVNGALISTPVKSYPILETEWGTIKDLYPEAKVISTKTGHSRNYGKYPYGNYRTNHSSLIFPVNHSDNRLNKKERVLGVIGKNAKKAYSFSEFQGGKFIIDFIGEEKFLIYGDADKNILTAFNITNRISESAFSNSSLPLPYIIQDNIGNHYNLFGLSMDAQKESLIPAKSFIAYWFAWAAFYPDTDLYN
jgi:Protein of unknown function (DUF3179)